MTIETTYSQARAQLKSLMDRAVDDRVVIVVRRRTAKRLLEGFKPFCATSSMASASPNR